VVCGFNILHYGSVIWKTAVSVFVNPNCGFGSDRFIFGLFCFQLSASVTQRTMNGFLCFNALQRWQSACVTLLLLICSLNYTFNRDTRHSLDDEIKLHLCLTVLHKHLLPVKPTKKHIFSCECPFQILWFLNDCFLNKAWIVLPKWFFHLSIVLGFVNFRLLGNRYIWQILLFYGSNCLRFHTLLKILIFNFIFLPTKNNVIINTHHSHVIIE